MDLSKPGFFKRNTKLVSIGIIILTICNCNLIYSQLKQNEIQVTNIANEGFLIKSINHKILIDALFSDGYGIFAVPSKDLINQIMEAKTPFDSISLYFLTHYHKDHCDPGVISKYLKKYPDIKIVTNKPSLVFIDGEQFGFVLQQKQFCEITPGINQSISQTINDIPVKVFGLKHLSYFKDGIDLEEYMYNAGYLVDLDGIKIFHSGDIMINSLRDYIERKGKWNDRIDIAFLYCDLIKDESDLEFILTTLNPRYIVIMHVPPADNNKWQSSIEKLKKRFANIVFFKNSMDTQNFNLN